VREIRAELDLNVELVRPFPQLRAWRKCPARIPSADNTGSNSAAAPATVSGEPDAPIIYVCITCRRAGEPESEPRPGAILAEATAKAAAGSGVVVRPVRCLVWKSMIPYRTQYLFSQATF
jgi:hypothetical protein